MKDELIIEVDKHNDTVESEQEIDGRSAAGTDARSESPEPRKQYQPDMTIKQMLGGEDKEKVKDTKNRSPKEPPRLEEGTIPSSPELTSKIANVLQLENKLKRRKFEIEKRSSDREVPPPPQKPGGDAKSLPEEGAKGIPTDRSKDDKGIDDLREGSKLPSGPEEIKSSDKQVHTPSEKPYPIGLVNGEGPEEDEEEELEELEELEEVEEPKQKKKKRRGIFSLFSRGR